MCKYVSWMAYVTKYFFLTWKVSIKDMNDYITERGVTKANDAVLRCFLWYAAEQTIQKTIETPVIRDATALIITSQ